MFSINTKAIEKYLMEQEYIIDVLHSRGEREGWSDLESLARCHYYLHNVHATDYLLRAADAMTIVSHTSLLLIHQANLYFMAGDRFNTERVVGQLHTLMPDRFWKLTEQRFHLFLLACGEYLRGDYAACAAYHAPFLALFTPQDSPHYADWIMELVTAQITHNAALALKIAIILQQDIRKHHTQPWETHHINMWDWYQRADHLAESLM